MASYHKKTGGKYCIRWKDPDGTHRQHTVSGARVARDLCRDAQAAEDVGRAFEPLQVGRSGLVVARPGVKQPTALGAYLVDMRRMWKPSTHAIRTVELQTWATWLLDNHRAPLVGMFCKAWLSGYWSHLIEDRGCSPATANDRVRTVTAFWSWLHDSDDYGEDTPRPRPIALPETPRELPPAPTWAQMALAVRAAQESQVPWWGQYFEVMRCTGLRGGQVMRLLWSDLDLDAGKLRIRGELGKSKQERQGRVIPVAPCLLESLAGWGVREGWLIKPTGCDGRTTDNRHPSHATQRQLWTRTGAPEAVYRQPAHTFRRGFITGLARAGVDPEARMALVGHSRGTHGDTYTDDHIALEDRMVAAVAKVPSLEDALKEAAFRAPFALASGGDSGRQER